MEIFFTIERFEEIDNKKTFSQVVEAKKSWMAYYIQKKKKKRQEEWPNQTIFDE